MNKEKQIEEMAFNLIMATSPLGVKDLTKQFDYKTVATDLYELYGWRKASDVAREICDAADEIINLICMMTGIEITAVGGKYLELRKKYTEGEE